MENQEENKIIRLSELAHIIRAKVQEGFGARTFRIVGEVANYNQSVQGQHRYFHLIEKNAGSGKIEAELSVTAFYDAALEIQHFDQITGSAFRNGIEILAEVTVNFHPSYGLKLNLIHLDAGYTLGQMHLARERTLHELITKDPEAVKLVNGRYISRNQSATLPRVVQRLAVISSEGSAGLEDFEHTLNHNPEGYHYEYRLFSTKVQGDSEGRLMRDKLVEIYHEVHHFDCVIIVRGGGGQTDFLMYDAYPIARAVARFPIPVITGLGHHKDISITDMMAHTSLKTPTQVAEFLIDHNRLFEEELYQTYYRLLVNAKSQLVTSQNKLLTIQKNTIGLGRKILQTHRNELSGMHRRMSVSAAQGLHQAKSDVALCKQSISHQIPRLLAYQREFLKGVKVHLKTAALNELKLHKKELVHLGEVFHLLSPARTLERGFALVYRDGKLETDATKIEEGKSIVVYLNNRNIKAIVKENNESKERKFDL